MTMKQKVMQGTDLLYKGERALIFITALFFVAFSLSAGEIRWTGGGTVTFKADTSVNLTEKPASAFTFAETDGVFSGMPVAASMRRWKMVMSQDRKSIRIVPPGFDRATVWMRPEGLSHPVWGEMITGRVFEIPEKDIRREKDRLLITVLASRWSR